MKPRTVSAPDYRAGTVLLREGWGGGAQAARVKFLYSPNTYGARIGYGGPQT